MPDISITDDQRERLEAIREDIEAAYVDTYGQTRLEDTIEYLLDTYTPPDDQERVDAYDRIAAAEYPELQRVASDVEGIPGSGIDADEMRGRLLSELGPDALAAELAAASDDDVDATGATAANSETTDDPTGPDTARSGDTSPGHGADTDSDGGADDTAVGSLLATTNELLNEHEDKWRESDGETPYEVDLPDGTTEPARTKDDVRQLLFRNY